MAGIEDMEDEFEGAGAAASAFMDILDKIPRSLGSIGSAASSLNKFKSLGDAVAGFGRLVGGVKQGRDELGRFTQAAGPLDGIGQAIAGLGPYGAAAAAAITVLTGAFVVLVGAMAAGISTAVEVNQHLEMMRARFDALAGGSKAGGQVLSMVQALGRELPFAQAQIEGWATSLQAAGFKGRGLEDAIRATAAATALMGESGGAAAQDLIKRLAEGGQGATKMMKSIQEGAGKSNKLLAEMGLTTADVAAAAGLTPDKFKNATLSAEQMNAAIQKALSVKGKGPLDAMGNDAGVIFGKVREGLASAFEGLAPMVQPFMGAVKSIASEFMRGGVAVNILRAIVTPVFGTLLGWGTKLVSVLHKGFLMIAIGALQLYIRMRPAIEALKQFVTSGTFLSGLKTLLIGLAIGAALLALPFVLAAGATLLLLVAIGALVAGFVWLIGAVVDFVSGAASAFGEWVAGAASAAGDFISGLVDGITSGAGAVVDAVKNLASSALASFKGVFGIASPSKVMLEHGEANIAGATATGIDRGAGQVDDAMARLGQGDKPGGGGGKGGSSKGGGRSYDFRGSTIQLFGVEDFDSFTAKMDRWLEEKAGEGPQPEPT